MTPNTNDTIKAGIYEFNNKLVILKIQLFGELLVASSFKNIF